MSFSAKHHEAIEVKQQYNVEAILLEHVDGQSFVTAFDLDSQGAVKGKRIVNPSDLVTKFSSQQDTDKGFIDPRILVNTRGKIVWHYTPRSNQNLYYRYGSNSMAKPIKWCSFLFKYESGRLSIAVLRSKQRPTLTTRIYHAPLPNVHSNGDICLGSCVLPKTGNIDQISEAYFESTKTHMLSGCRLRGKENLSDKDLFKWLESKVENPIRVSELTPFGTVQNFI